MAQILTPLGKLKFKVESAGVPMSGGSILIASFKPKIPPGMSVSACYAVVLAIDALSTVFDLKFQALLEPVSTVSSGASTGEALEAQEWNNQDHVMLVGTEDREYLGQRLPHSIILPDAPFAYSPESLSIHIAQVPSGQHLSLHFIVAWNALPEIVAPSCWFAVDQPHQSVLSIVGANPALGHGAKRAGPR